MSYYLMTPKDEIGNHPGGTVRILCRFGPSGVYFSEAAWRALLPNQDTAIRRNARAGEVTVKRHKGDLPWDALPDDAVVAVPVTEERLLRHYPHQADQPHRCMNPQRCDPTVPRKGDDYDAEACGHQDDRCLYTPVTRLVFRAKSGLDGPPPELDGPPPPSGPLPRPVKPRPPRRPLPPAPTDPDGPAPAATAPRGSGGRFAKAGEADS